MRRILILVTLATGCTEPNPGGQQMPTELTYYQNAAPILGARCTSCHQEGGIAPFALTTYAESKPHASRIVYALENELNAALAARPAQRE
jgi:hypothetical protein